MAGPFATVARRHLGWPVPLLGNVLLSIETHALCGALAFFAMLGFYPLSLLLVSLAKYVLRSPEAHEVIRLAVQSYYPAGQQFVLRNLEASSWRFRDELSVRAALWIFLGGAGVFIPLEMAFNRLWGFTQHRPYWYNQVVGLALTIVCWLLAVALMLVISVTPAWYRAPALWLAMPVFAAITIFVLYRWLPHGRVPSAVVLPAAVLTAVAGEVVRWAFLLVLPALELEKSHGPFQVSISFLMFVYVEAFVLLAGAQIAAEATHEQERRLTGVGTPA